MEKKDFQNTSSLSITITVLLGSTWKKKFFLNIFAFQVFRKTRIFRKSFFRFEKSV